MVVIQRMEQCNGVSSVDAVLQNNDLLMEITIRSPLKEVLKFKCVSRAWNNMISDPKFRRKYISERKNSPLPFVGFFHTTFWCRINEEEPGEPRRFTFMSTSKEGKSMAHMISQGHIKELGSFMRASPEGLILCGWSPSTFYVWNPLQNHWLSLPDPSMEGGATISIGFSCDECDENGIVNFKVVRCIVDFSRLYDSKMVIETLSSRTNKWCVSQLSSPAKFELVLVSMCEVVGGVFYWEAEGNFVAAHDPRISNNHVWLMRLPVNEYNVESRDLHRAIRAFGQSLDGLLKCALRDTSGFQIWILKKKLSEYSFSHTIQISEWVLTDTVKYSSLSINYPRSMNLGCAIDNPLPRGYPAFCFMSAFHPQDSQLVYLRLSCDIYCYNLENRTIEFVEYEGFSLSPCYYDLVPYIQPAWPATLPLI